jgi:hypothetical protein
MMSDTFRKVYKPLSDEGAKLVVDVKEAAEVIEGLLSSLKIRESALALTNLEQCTMWATKAIVLLDKGKDENHA